VLLAKGYALVAVVEQEGQTVAATLQRHLILDVLAAWECRGAR
jgi:hypothetical protein